MKTLTFFFLFPALIYSSSVYGQDYISKLQLNDSYDIKSQNPLTLSNSYYSYVSTKVSYFEEGVFLVRTNTMICTDVYRITLMNKEENDGSVQAMYTVEKDDARYDDFTLGVMDYKNGIEINGATYYRSFTFFSISPNTTTIHYSITYYVQPK